MCRMCKYGILTITVFDDGERAMVTWVTCPCCEGKWNSCRNCGGEGENTGIDEVASVGNDAFSGRSWDTANAAQ